MAPILKVDQVSKRFGGLQALDHISFELEPGRILGLLGPNGAGKTTLFNVVNGVYRPERGRIHFRGQDITGRPPYDVARLGLARTHQIVRPLNELSVRENVTAGACFGRHGHGLGQARKIADEVMGLVGLSVKADLQAASLNVAQKKRLELARALAAQPYLLLLDEVLAGLNPSEIAEMVLTIRRIRDTGISIFMIEHVMHAIMNLSDDIIVLDFGQQIAAGTPQQVAEDPKVIEAYLGDPRLARQLLAEDE